MVSDERRSNFSQTDGEQWTAKDKCFGKLTKKIHLNSIFLESLVGNRVWFVNLRDRTRTVEAFTALMKELYKPQSKKIFI